MSQESPNVGPFNPGSLIKQVSSRERQDNREIVPLSEDELKLDALQEEFRALRDRNQSGLPIHHSETGSGKRIGIETRELGSDRGIEATVEDLERMLQIAKEARTISNNLNLDRIAARRQKSK